LSIAIEELREGKLEVGFKERAEEGAEAGDDDFPGAEGDSSEEDEGAA
jgi:DNA-directed RNA polymerase subunit omega